MKTNNIYDNMKQYVVKSGDSLYMIAKGHNTTVEDLKKVNHLYSNTIYPNQILFIPNNDEYSYNCKGNTYITNQGESLKDIFIKFNINLNDITSYNDIDKLKLEGNQMLLIERVNCKKYKIDNNDKIEDILAKNNLSPLEFIKLNEDEFLKPGTEIIIER